MYGFDLGFGYPTTRVSTAMPPETVSHNPLPVSQQSLQIVSQTLRKLDFSTPFWSTRISFNLTKNIFESYRLTDAIWVSIQGKTRNDFSQIHDLILVFIWAQNYVK